ncbi:MAG: hypothetical protein U0575_14210 [Phycisphaerales bacterium]
MTRAHSPDGPRAGAATTVAKDSAASPPRESSPSFADAPRVSTIAADRLCVACGHNLIGQPVVREPHYGLIVARCPECGEVAALQEYPLLGRWGNRLGLMLAAICMAIGIALVVASSLALTSMTMGVGGAFATGLTRQVEQDLQRWAASALPATPWWQARAAPEAQQWWDEQGGLDGFVTAHGGWFRCGNRMALLLWIPCAAAATSIGVVWSVLLLGVRRQRLWAIGLVLIGLAATFEILVISADLDLFSASGARGWFDEAYRSAMMRLDWPVRGVTLALLAVALAVGFAVGRPLARAATCLLLPPRFRGVLSILWTADGKPPPRAADR